MNNSLPTVMNRIFHLSSLMVCVVLAFSCSQQQAVPPVEKGSAPPVYVGKVERVYPEHRYVLITLAGTVYEPGTVLISQSQGLEENRRVANLIVTEERLGGSRIPADIRSGAVEAGDLVFLYRNMAVPESSGKTEDPDQPDPETEKKEITPPLSPDGGKTPDGLLPLPGQSVVPEPAAVTPEEQENISRERERIRRELDRIPDKMDDPWKEYFSGKPAAK